VEPKTECFVDGRVEIRLLWGEWWDGGEWSVAFVGIADSGGAVPDGDTSGRPTRHEVRQGPTVFESLVLRGCESEGSNGLDMVNMPAFDSVVRPAHTRFP